MTLDELTALFRKLGAPDPEGWARSQHEDGIDQLGRFVFLRQAWKSVIDPDDTSWMDRVIEADKKRPLEPCAGLGPALERLMAAGGARADIQEVVRVMQYQVLFSFCYLLGDPGELEPELSDMSWCLARTNDDDEIVGTIDSLHESVLGTDPTGREMRPKVR
jgi:hypothetical protein